MARLPPFGIALRKHRIDRGETLMEAARAMKVSVSFCSAIETGKKNASPEMLDKIVAHFRVSESDGAHLRRLARVSRREVKIPTAGLDDRRRQILESFARKFSELDDEQLMKLEKIFKIGE